MSRKMHWTSPNGVRYTIPGFEADILKRAHVLIAGTTGAGKSTLINSIMYHITALSPANNTVALIDPKKVELSKWQNIPQCYRYTDTVDGAINVLNESISIIERRFQRMKENGDTMYKGPDHYVIIDELADLVLTSRKVVLPLLQRIGQIGRAARVHLIAATQCPLATVIPTEIKVNFDGIVGLRTRSAQDSRNIIGIAGCENLPMYGKCLYQTPVLHDVCLFDVPYHTDEEIRARIKFAEDQIPKSLFGRKKGWTPAVVL